VASDPLVGALVEAVGPSHVLVDDELTAAYRTDWTGRWTGECRAVVRPADTAEVAEVIRCCAAAGVAIVPQGGNTGLVGATVPTPGSVVLSSLRLDQVGDVDDLTGQITAQAGATIAELHRATSGSGWHYPVDFAARGSATVGGSIATNAGGHHVVRHGMTRSHVVGIEAVLADGSVVSHLGGLIKDNTGYDLAGLLCGSEGTLAVITAARLALVPDDPETATALVAFESTDHAVASLGTLRRAVPGLDALELMFAAELAAVGELVGARLPVAVTPAVLLVEASGTAASIETLATTLATLDGVVDTAVAVDAPRRESLWRWRDHHTETINRLGTTPPHKLDVTLPLHRLAEFVGAVTSLVAEIAPSARLWLFGHAGDGNLHVNITGLDADDDSVDDAVLRMVASLDGSISAEHGIGRAKRDWLHLVRTTEEIAAFRSIKSALDPSGTFSPGVLLPEDESPG
jgi:FAD/FMN-containing dehydrogenase